MKKILSIVFVLFVLGAGVVFALSDKASKKMNSDKMNIRILVAYFSATGNTKNVAQNLAQAVKADIYEIKPLKPYTKEDLNWRDKNSRSSVEMYNPTIRPEIVSDDFSPEGYDKIFLGFPIWKGTAPNIIHTFLEKYDFSGKNIIIFATSGSSGLGNTANDLKSSVSDSAKIINGKVLNSNPSVKELKEWAESIK